MQPAADSRFPLQALSASRLPASSPLSLSSTLVLSRWFNSFLCLSILFGRFSLDNI
jgi:hypothetical protein